MSNIGVATNMLALRFKGEAHSPLESTTPQVTSKRMAQVTKRRTRSDHSKLAKGVSKENSATQQRFRESDLNAHNNKLAKEDNKAESNAHSATQQRLKVIDHNAHNNKLAKVDNKAESNAHNGTQQRLRVIDLNAHSNKRAKVDNKAESNAHNGTQQRLRVIDLNAHNSKLAKVDNKVVSKAAEIAVRSMLERYAEQSMV